MKTKVIAVLVILLSVISGLSASSQIKLAVVYDGATQVNREAINFFNRLVRSQSSGISIQPVDAGQDLKSGQYQAYLFMNTGLSSGVDPVIAKAIKSLADKSKAILVNLKAGSYDMTVQSLAPSNETLGIDAVAAASAWGGRQAMDMHTEWVSRVLKLLGAKTGA